MKQIKLTNEREKERKKKKPKPPRDKIPTSFYIHATRDNTTVPRVFTFTFAVRFLTSALGTRPSIGLGLLLGLVGRRRRAALPVLVVRLLEHVVAAQLGVQPGADEEGAAHLPVQRVGLLRRRGEPVLEHHRDEVVDPLGGGLRAELEGLFGGERLAQDHHRVHVGVDHRLDEGRKEGRPF